MDARSRDGIAIDLHFRIEELGRLKTVVKAVASWRSVLAPTSVMRIGDEPLEEPWSLSRELPLSRFASADDRAFWVFRRAEDTVAMVRRLHAGICVSLRPGDLGPGSSVDAILELLDTLAGQGIHPAMVIVSRRSGADGDFTTQGLDELRDVPPILYLDDVALARFGGREHVRTQVPPVAWREADAGALFIARADPMREPDAADWTVRDRIATALGVAPGRPLVIVGSTAAPLVTAARPIDEVDRNARGFERAVLTSSVIGGAPLVLDRTIESLPALERWCSDMRDGGEAAGRVSMVADYLAMLARAVRGVDVDVAALGVRETAERLVRGGGPGDFAARLAAMPAAGPPYERIRVITLKLHVTPWDLDVANRAETALIAAIPELADAELDTQDEDAWSLIVDPDELRADLGAETVSVTVRIAPGAVRERLQEIVRALSPRPRLGVAYDIDVPSSILYILRGAPSGLPGWLIEGNQLVDLTGEREPFASRGLEQRWPHRPLAG